MTHCATLRILLVLGLISGTVRAVEDPLKLQDLAAAGWSISNPLSIDQAELQGLDAVLPHSQTPRVPFGRAHAAWQDFKEKYEPGDTLLQAVSPPETWKGLSGWRGYVIVRSGRVVAMFSTHIS